MAQPPPQQPTLRPGALLTPDQDTLSADIVIVGTGMGGGTLAWALKDSGLNVLLVERGQFLPREPENSQPDHVFIKKRYVTSKPWYDAKTGKPVPARRLLLGGREHQDVRGLPASVPSQRLLRDRPPRRHVAGLAVPLRRPRTVLRQGRTALRGARRSRRGPHRTRALDPLSLSAAQPRTCCGAACDRVAPPGPAPLPHAQRHAPRHYGRTACRRDRGRLTVVHRSQERRREPSGAGRRWSSRTSGCCSGRTSVDCGPATTGTP